MKKIEVILCLFCAIVFIFLIYMFVDGFSKQSSLHQNREDTKAVIINFRSGSKNSFYLDYNYFVNGIKHQGCGEYYPRRDILSVGDTIIVVYDKTNPSSSKTYRDYDYRRETRPFIIPTFIFLVGLTWWGVQRRFQP